MANSTARWHGDNYQSRHFWIHASSLLDEQRRHVVQVTFEATDPKAFDDIVVYYDPARPSSTQPERVSVDHFQIKWHTDYSGHFGFNDLIDPKFIGATSISILERLREAKKTCPQGSAFHFVTTYGLKELDQLTELVSGTDGSLRLDKLFDGAGPKSKMGRVRECWREHLGFETDEELRAVLAGFHIEHGAKNLENLRSEVAYRFRNVGLNGRETETTFVYDDFARALVTKKINRLDRATFKKLCEEEGWFLADPPKPRRGVSIQVYGLRATPADLLLAAPEHTLALAHHFDGRQLKDGESWEVIRDEVAAFLKADLLNGTDVRLFLEAPSSIAFLAGSCLGLKSGASAELVQMGYGSPSQIWDVNDGRSGPAPVIEHMQIGDGRDTALIVSMTRNALPKVTEYLRRDLPGVGRIIHVTPENGPGQTSITGGAHALAIANIVGCAVSDAVLPRTRTHVFLAAPNALSFLLGQQVDAMGACIPYEFDFKKQTDGSYVSTFDINSTAP